MAAPGIASMAPFLTLTKGQVIRIDALDPVTGAQVAGVVVSKFSVAVDQEDTTLGGSSVPVSGALLPGTV